MIATVYLHEKKLAEEAADRNFQAIAAEAPWMQDLLKLLDPIVALNASNRSRYRKLIALADRVNETVARHSACSRGCSACCHIAVNLSAIEADLIGEAIGVKPQRVQGHSDPQGIQDEYFGKPCSFLKGDECSIYEHRPLECRLHASIGHSPFFCSTDVPPSESVVPTVSVSPFHAAYAMRLIDRRLLADIREFFPNEAAK